MSQLPYSRIVTSGGKIRWANVKGYERPAANSERGWSALWGQTLQLLHSVSVVGSCVTCGGVDGAGMACKLCNKKYAHCPAHQDDSKTAIRGHVLCEHRS